MRRRRVVLRKRGSGGYWSKVHGIGLFFSSRRRHTRFDCDWSSDVCSSDLLELKNLNVSSLNSSAPSTPAHEGMRQNVSSLNFSAPSTPAYEKMRRNVSPLNSQIGRASCRERV